MTGLFLDEGTTALPPAYFPASAIGGATLNLGLGGDGVRGGVACAAGEIAVDGSIRALRGAGGAGGGPRRDAVVLPVFCGLIGRWPPGGTAGGRGGALERGSSGSVPFVPILSFCCCWI